MSGLISGGNYRTKSSWFDCSVKHGCPRPVLFKTTQISVNRNGNIETLTIKQPTIPFWKYQSQVIQTSRFTSRGRLVYGNLPLNEYGYWSGGPSGSGMPPRNTF
jgi:hypothetical protein